jgi:hypothetical protein
MTFAQADNLFQKILECFKEAGGIYENPCQKAQENILISLAYNHFIIKIRNGKVRWFLSYLRIDPAEMEKYKTHELTQDNVVGSMMYISEAANLDGREGMKEIVKAIKKEGVKHDITGVFWHRPEHKKICSFPNKRGN